MASRSGRLGRISPSTKQLMQSSSSSSNSAKRPIASSPVIAATTTSSSSSNNKPSPSANSGEEGCRVCRRDEDHANLLLCEACNDEYHTYCLSPPLQEVPEGDFFCGEFRYSLLVHVSLLHHRPSHLSRWLDPPTLLSNLQIIHHQPPSPPPLSLLHNHKSTQTNANTSTQPKTTTA